jgi:hypothetical protein
VRKGAGYAQHHGGMVQKPGERNLRARRPDSLRHLVGRAATIEKRTVRRDRGPSAVRYPVSVCLTLAGKLNETSSLPGFERTKRAAAFSRRKRKKSARNSAICSCAARMWPSMLLRWRASQALAAIQRTVICGRLVNFRGAGANPCARRKTMASAFITVRRTDSGRRCVVRYPPGRPRLPIAQRGRFRPMREGAPS